MAQSCPYGPAGKGIFEVKFWNNKTRFGWVALLVLSLALVLALCFGLSRSPPQIITLPDGSRYRFAGATWGTNHSKPRLAARLMDQLPGQLAYYVRPMLERRLGSLAPVRNDSPSLCIWLQRVGTNTQPSPNTLDIILADQNGVESGGSVSARMVSGPFANTVCLPVVPRRNPVLEVHLIYTVRGANPGPIVSRQKLGQSIRFPNPLFGTYPQWQPEPLPARKQAGDLDVSLSNLATGSVFTLMDHDGRVHPPGIRPAKPGETPSTLIALGLSSPRGTNEIWLPQNLD